MERDNIPARALEISEKCKKTFEGWKEKYEVVGDVRGIGCMMGVEFITDKKTKAPNSAIVDAIVAEAVTKGLLLENAGTYGNVIRFLAPLVITDEQVDAGLKIFEEALVKCMK